MHPGHAHKVGHCLLHLHVHTCKLLQGQIQVLSLSGQGCCFQICTVESLLVASSSLASGHLRLKHPEGRKKRLFSQACPAEHLSDKCRGNGPLRVRCLQRSGRTSPQPSIKTTAAAKKKGGEEAEPCRAMQSLNGVWNPWSFDAAPWHRPWPVR